MGTVVLVPKGKGVPKQLVCVLVKVPNLGLSKCTHKHTHSGSKTTKGDGPHAASLSGKEDTRDEGGREKRGRRGVHLESAHPLQEG